MSKRFAKSVTEKGKKIELSTETYRVKFIHLDPLDVTYRKKRRSLEKAGYEVVEDFNPRWLKTQNVKDENGTIVQRKMYHGTIKLQHKG